jgi:hypothetical protein
MIILAWCGVVENAKSPLAESPAGWGTSEISIGLLLRQAMQVRRHGMPMMVVMAVMAEALHLEMKVTKRGKFVKSRWIGRLLAFPPWPREQRRSEGEKPGFPVKAQPRIQSRGPSGMS